MTIDNLRTLITRKFHCSPIGGSYQLIEPQVSGFPVTKIKAGGEVFLCRFDGHAHNLTPFFDKDVERAHAMVDYIAFAESKGTCFVFLIELSKTKPKTYQRGPAQRFIEYIEATAKSLYYGGQPFQYRYLIVNTSPAKGFTKPGKLFINGKGEWRAGKDLNLLHLCT